MSTSAASDAVLTAHDQFSVLASLIALCAAANSGGAPVLSSGESVIYRGAFERSIPEYRTALNALASQVVREHEIIAVGAPFARPPPVDRVQSRRENSRPNAAMEPVTTMAVFAMQDITEETSDIEYPPSLDFTAVGNSRPQEHLYGPGDLESTDLKRIVVDRSQWGEIKAHGWKYLRTMLIKYESGEENPPSLSNHIATIEHYLKDYRVLPQSASADKTMLFFLFSFYSIFTTWPKMHRRIDHRRSKEVINVIQDFPHDYFGSTLEAYLSKETAGRLPFETRYRDLALSNFFIENFKHIILLIFGNRRFKVLAYDSELIELKNLRAAFEKHQQNAKNNIQSATFTTNTALEFHSLFLAVLFTQRDSLAQFNAHRLAKSKLSSQKQLDESERAKLKRQVMSIDQQMSNFQKIWLTTILLWRISHSSIIREYFHFIASLGYFQNFNSSCMEYNILLRGNGNPKPTDPPEEEGDLEDDIIMCVDTEAETDSPNNTALACQRWLCYIVSNISSLDVISRFVNRHQSTNITIRLLGIRPPLTNKTLPWKSVMICALKDSGIDEGQATSTLQYIIREMRTTRGMGRVAHAFPYEIGNEKKNGDKVTLSGAVHCEAALASVSSLSSDLHSDKFGDDSLSSITVSEIGVSRLCCPICWQLLKILGCTPNDDKEPGFGVRGRHSTLFFVQLPSWLSETHVNALFDHFKSVFCTELQHFLTKRINERKSEKLRLTHRPQNSEVLSEAGSSATYSSDGQIGPMPPSDTLFPDLESDNDFEHFSYL